MKKTLCFVLASMLFFACKLNVENKAENKPIPKDTSLRQLVAQIGDEKIELNAPIEKEVTINLPRKIESKTPLVITAVPKRTGVSVFFDGSSESSKTKQYKTLQEKIKIELKAENSTSTTYTLTVKEPNSPSPKPPADDATLKTLIIKQGLNTLKNLQTPIEEAISVELPKKVSATDKLRIEATPKEETAKVYFDSVIETSKTKEYVEFKSKIVIKVEKGSATKTYTLNITEPADDATLKTLIIKQGLNTLKNLQTPIEEAISVELPKKVSATDKLRIEATPKEETAKVYFDSVIETSKTKEYVEFKSKIIIKVEKGSATKTYTLNITEPNIPQPLPNSNVICNVVDSVGGSNIEGVRVKVYLTGTQTEIGVSTTDVNGNAYFELEVDKAYDFVLSKKGRAASRVENAYVKQDEKRVLPIVMKEWFVGSKKVAPEINDILLGTRKDNKWKYTVIKDNFELDCSALESSSSLFADTTCKSGEVIPEKFAFFNNNKGFGMNIGSPFRNDIGYAMTWPERVALNSKGDTIIRDSNGVVTQRFSFPISSLIALNGEITLYFVAYDEAGNRCERQERIRIKNGGLKNEVDTVHSFYNFIAFSERYYNSLNTFSLNKVNPFGMPSEGGVPTSQNVIFNFRFNQNIAISRVDVMRREYRVGNIQDGWQCVYTRQHVGGFRGDSQGWHVIYDDSGTLEEGKTYQYKLVACGSNGKITSNVATIRIMESFNLLLTSPASRATIKRSEIKNQDFSFKISNTSLWNKERADYFSFGALVLRDQYAEYKDAQGKTQYFGLCFGAKLKYDFTKTGDDAFLVAGAARGYDDYDYKVFNTLENATSLSLDDVFKYENGTITLKNKFFATASFNTFGKLPLERTVYAGIHYWDVPNMAKNLLVELHDRGVAFVKEYPYLDAMTGDEVPNAGKSLSSSYSNLTRSSGAVNGRSVFTVEY